MLDAFLAELANEAGKSLPPYEVEGFVAEAREHLEESIQARLELGLSREEAVRESIAVFGDVRRVASEMEPRDPLIDRRFLLVSLGLVVYWAIAWGRSFPDGAVIPVLGSCAALHGAYWLRSARLRRPQWATLLTIFGTLWIALAIPRGLDEAAFIRDNLSGGFARNRAWRASSERKESALASSYETFRRSPSPLSPSRVPSYTPKGDLRLYPRVSVEEATARWQEALRHGQIGFRHERQSLAASDAAQARLARMTVFAFVLRALGTIFATVGWGPATFYAGTHLLAWLLGVALRRSRRQAPRATG